MRFRHIGIVVITTLCPLFACTGDNPMGGEHPDGQVGGGFTESGAPDRVESLDSAGAGGGGGVHRPRDGAMGGAADSAGASGTSGFAGEHDSGNADRLVDSARDAAPDGAVVSSDASDGGGGNASPDASDAGSSGAGDDGGESAASDAGDASPSDAAEDDICFADAGDADVDGQCVPRFARLAFQGSTDPTSTIMFPLLGGANRAYIPFVNSGNLPTGALSLTNTDPQSIVAEIFSCISATGEPISPAEGLPAGGFCSMQVTFVATSPGLHAAQVRVSASPGGTITLTASGRVTIQEGQLGCTESADCPADCSPCSDPTCTPCQGGTCITVFIDFDNDGFGRGPTTVCNRILPGTVPRLSLFSNDCDDSNPAIHPGASVCSSGDDPNAVVSCRDDGTLDVQTCSAGACMNGQCVGDAGTGGE